MRTQLQAMDRRDVLAISAAIMGIVVLAWIYLFSVASDMSMSGMNMMGAAPPWGPGYFLMMFFMWAIMMVGMMLPSVAPTVLVYASVARKSREQGAPTAPTASFVSGYVLLWTLFSLAATGAQWGLSELGLLSAGMTSSSAALTAGLLIFAGLYQWLPLKNQCLSHCQSPVRFISSHWAAGTMGALRMGIQHGFFCLGCCWVLMLLLFVGGVMNLVWIAVLALYVLLEKMLPFGSTLGKGMGVMMILGGVAMAIIGF